MPERIILPNQQEFHETMEKMIIDDRFLTAALNPDQAIDWKCPEDYGVLSKIQLEGWNEAMFYVTDSMSGELNPDAVFGIWKDEQYVTHTFSQRYIDRVIQDLVNCVEPRNLLDVGTGAGISALLMQKQLLVYGVSDIKVIGIDQNERAIEFATGNEKLNGLSGIEWKQRVYSLDSAPLHQSAIIQLEPPYNPRPNILGKFSTQFSDGLSEDATQNFTNQIIIALEHLAPNGIIVANQMTPSFNNLPGALEIIKKLDPSLSVDYIEIFDPMSSKDFLDSSFGFDTNNKNLAAEINSFRRRLTNAHQQFHYNVLIIKKDGKSEINRKEHDLSFGSFGDRAIAHKGINTGAVQQFRTKNNI
jgi:SAM-dependent methyltransferase